MLLNVKCNGETYVTLLVVKGKHFSIHLCRPWLAPISLATRMLSVWFVAWLLVSSYHLIWPICDIKKDLNLGKKHGNIIFISLSFFTRNFRLWLCFACGQVAVTVVPPQQFLSVFHPVFWNSWRPRFWLHTFEARALIMNGNLLQESFVRRLAKVAGQQVRAFYFTAHQASGNSIDFVAKGLWYLEEGEGHTQSHTKSTLHTISLSLC